MSRGCHVLGDGSGTSPHFTCARVGVLGFPSVAACASRVRGMEPTTMPGRPRDALMKTLRPVRPEHFGSLQPVAFTHPSFRGNTPVMSFLSPQPFWHKYDITSAELSGLVFSMLSEFMYVTQFMLLRKPVKVMWLQESRQSG